MLFTPQTQTLFSFFFKDKISGPELAKKARLDCQAVTGTHVPLFPQHGDYKPASLHGKDSTNWAISTAPVLDLFASLALAALTKVWLSVSRDPVEMHGLRFCPTLRIEAEARRDRAEPCGIIRTFPSFCCTPTL